MYLDDICEKYNIKNYKINPDNSIDVDGNVDLDRKCLTELPIRFNKVTGHFDCSRNDLTTLKGCPIWVGGFFDCKANKLTSLEHSPDYVHGWFDCSSNKLIDNFSESEISGIFYTDSEQDGLVFDGYGVTNYKQFQKIMKRKRTLDILYIRYIETD